MTAPRTFAALAFGNWLSRAYLVVVALVIAGTVVAYVVDDGKGDANLAAVWPMFVTMPGSYAGVLLALLTDGPAGTVAVVAGVVAGALLNAFVLGLIVQAVRGPSPRTTPSPR